MRVDTAESISVSEYGILLACCIFEASRVREESYDKKAADAALAESMNSGTPNAVDFAQFYRKSLLEACDDGCSTLGVYYIHKVVFLALRHTWNESREWARDMLRANAGHERVRAYLTYRGVQDATQLP